ncbi:MAG: hypothetical protein HOM34_07010 [Planctomycetes bacterium]|jgi:aspartate-semialdehyde dehydrogenase|nr:hypothetical protein [Planctomycetota bacterium]MBT4029186.1 hypothetical protein [Planctomycetota bacterium]MBT4559267.1 hypothetical protein [Planctomycetota bacterium]MBT5120453.1 hypothetical protein [Planctomycetota bacterium]MBT7011882.1 hypothetical protein [Planctomycetota bacterium]
MLPLTEPTFCVVGASGLVGRVLVDLLRQSGLSAIDPRIVARKDILDLPSATAAFAGAHFVFLALPDAEAMRLAPAAIAAGASVIDLSGAFRLDPETPLIMPGINDAMIQPGILACPNCTTVGPALALHAIHQQAGLAEVTMTTFQSASGAGRAGLQNLADELADIQPICGVAAATGWSSEEESVQNEIKRLLLLHRLNLSATCTRVPIETGHAASLSVRTLEPLKPSQLIAIFEARLGLKHCSEPFVSTPRQAAHTDDILVSRVRASDDGRLHFWVSWCNLRRGAAFNAVKIAESLCHNISNRP